jgi:hypothetical protein
MDEGRRTKDEGRGTGVLLSSFVLRPSSAHEPAKRLVSPSWLARYAAIGLIVVGGLEWVFGRVISRFAAIPPLEGIGRTIVEALGRTGIFLISTAFILAATLFFTTTLRLGERANRKRDAGGLALALYLTLYGVFLAAHAVFTALSVFGDDAWLDVTLNILSLVAVWWVALKFILTQDARRKTKDVSALPSSIVHRPSSRYAALAFKVAVLLIAIAYSAWYYSVLYSWVAGPGATGVGGPVDALQLGEVAAVLVPLAFFVAMAVPGGEWKHPRRWIVPAIALVLFAGGNIADIIANMGFTGVFAIWSVGFTLWMPWPIYALSLAAFIYLLLTCFGKTNGAESPFVSMNRGLGLLLLLFAGYYLQLTYQDLLALLAVLLLTGIARPFEG